MKTTKVIFTILLILFVTCLMYSQDDPSKVSIPSKQVPYNLPYEASQSDRPVVHAQNNYTTDEFGIYGINGVLGGLGAATKYVSVPYNNIFDQNFDGSVEMWIYQTALGSGSSVLISKGSTSSVAFMFGLVITTNKLFFRIGSTIYSSSGAAINLNTWTHVAAIWSGGPSTFNVKFYINGAQDGTTQTAAATWNLGSEPVYIGGSQYFSTNYFTGYIDEVRFWETERTAVEIRDNRFVGLGDGGGANAGSALTSSAAYTGLVSSWTFNTGGTAYDDIGGYNGTYTGGAVSIATDPNLPIPYNLALYLPGGANDNVRIPSNSIFTGQTANGSIEMWLLTTSLSPEQIMIAKGATGSTVNFMLGINSSGKLFFRTANNPITSDGPSIVINTWTHVAVTWSTSGSNFNINFYVNGEKNGSTKTIPNSYPTDASQVYIGNSQPYNEPFRGYIDEVRFWGGDLTPVMIRQRMYASCKQYNSAGAFYNFDGNLNNFSSTTGINGTFNNGSANNARLSGYRNENTSGFPSQSLLAHPTCINGLAYPDNKFPDSFWKRYPLKAITDLDTLKDTIIMTAHPSTVVTDVKVFLAIQHSYTGDLDIFLQAPNGTQYNLSMDNGGSSDNGYLTIFGDGAGNPVTSATRFAPYSNFIKPQSTLGSFGSSQINGRWILKVFDDANGDVGVLRSWALRFNNFTTDIEQISNTVPVKYLLYQNYPNPFNPVTKIKFEVPKSEFVRISVFDILGREVKTLVNEKMTPGVYEYEFNAGYLSSGVYFYKMESGDFKDVKKMILVK